MGKKSSYFRHSFNAHIDPKIMKLMQLGGMKAVGCYWTILEIYGYALINDDKSKIEQEFNARHIATALGLRADSCRTVIELIADCELIGAVWFQSSISSVKVSIPNFLKYFGRYSKTETMKCPNKKKVKEKKVKEIKVNKPDLKVVQVINYLNEKIGKKFKSTAANNKHINARLNEGHTFEQFKKVINVKYSQWGADEKMKKYLRPETLFGTKFDSYLNEDFEETQSDRKHRLEQTRLEWER